MIRLIAIAFALTLAASAQAATLVAPLHQPDNVTVQDTFAVSGVE
jgi:hypothetical protein